MEYDVGKVGGMVKIKEKWGKMFRKPKKCCNIVNVKNGVKIENL